MKKWVVYGYFIVDINVRREDSIEIESEKFYVDGDGTLTFESHDETWQWATTAAFASGSWDRVQEKI